MKPLGNTYGKNGFHYEVILRRGPFAIAHQRLRPGAGDLAYEVFRVKELKECVMFGKTVEAHEAVPSNEEWGRLGWTYPTLEKAKNKMRELEELAEQGGVRAAPCDKQVTGAAPKSTAIKRIERKSK